MTNIGTVWDWAFAPAQDALLILGGVFLVSFAYSYPTSDQPKEARRVVFFFKGVSSQSLDAITLLERLGQLRAAYRERLRTERAAARLLQTLDVFYERSILNIRQLEAALDIPNRTAQRYIERLEEIGILREVTGQARNRLYRVDEILRSLEG